MADRSGDSCLPVFWTGSHARARLLFRAASRVHSDGPLRSCFYLSARTPVRSGGRRTQSPFPALALFTSRRRFGAPGETSSSPFGEEVIPLGDSSRCSCTEPRAHLLGCSRCSCTRSPSGARARSSYGQSILRSAFASRACSVLCPPQLHSRNFATTFWAFALLRACLLRGVLTLETSRSPFGFRAAPPVLTSALTQKTSRCLAALAMSPTCSRSACRA